MRPVSQGDWGLGGCQGSPWAEHLSPSWARGSYSPGGPGVSVVEKADVLVCVHACACVPVCKHECASESIRVCPSVCARVYVCACVHA